MKLRYRGSENAVTDTGYCTTDRTNYSAKHTAQCKAGQAKKFLADFTPGVYTRVKTIPDTEQQVVKDTAAMVFIVIVVLPVFFVFIQIFNENQPFFFRRVS